MIINREDFVINYSREDDEYVKSLDFKRMKSVISDFFQISDFSVKIKFCNSLDEFRFFFPYEFKEWICGFFTNDIIFVFSPRVIEEVTSHEKNEIPNIIFHELVHIIYKKLEFKRINLLYEGLAVYLTRVFSGSEEEIEDIDLNKVNVDDYPRMSKEVYEDGARVVSKLIEEKGKKELLKSLNENEEKLF